jgi:hypothetical protein
LKIVYTITSRKYLAKTKIAIKSFLNYNSEYEGFIFNIDKNIYSTENIWNDKKLIHQFVNQIHIENYDQLRLKYDDFEFCNSLKPYLSKWLFENHHSAETIVYIDSDLEFYSKIDDLSEIGKGDIIITPHSIHPIPLDNLIPSELDLMNSGIYNAGFYILNKSENTFQFIDWWMQRMLEFCYVDFKKGMFVDQIWLNLVPIYFKSVLILKNPGFNVAHWNLHERIINYEKNWYVNKSYKLVFFHFSGFPIDDINKISNHQNRYSLQNRNDLTEIFKNYKRLIEKYDAEIITLVQKPEDYFPGLSKISKRIKKWKKKISLMLEIITD